MFILHYCAFILSMLNLSVCSERLIHIGAIFETNSSSNIVFKYAVDRFNKFELRYHLRPYIYYVSENNGFNIEKIVCQMVSQKISAIFGPELLRTNEIVQSIAETLEVPQFQTFWNPKFDKKSQNTIRTIFSLYPDSRLYAKALAVLVKEMRWKTYTIIYQNDDGLVRLQDVLKIRKGEDRPIKVKKLDAKGDHRTVLKQIRDSSELQIILDCETDDIIEIFKQAQEVNLMDEYHSYILTSLDAHTLDFTKVRVSGANITTLRLLDPNSPNVIEASRYWEPDDHNTLFQAEKANIGPTAEKLTTSSALYHDAINFFTAGFKDLDYADKIKTNILDCNLPTVSKDGMKISRYLNSKPFYNGTLPGPLTGPIFLDHNNRRTNFELQVIEIAADGKKRKTGTWSSNNPHRINFTSTSQERELEIVQQLSQKMFKVSSRLGAPYLRRRKRKHDEVLIGNDRFEGYSIDLIKGISEILNFSFVFDIVPDNNYGSYNAETKEWNGLIRQLLDRKADLAVCDLTITYERRTAVDFTMPFMTLGISILYSKAMKPPPEIFSFTFPLSLDVWLFMATAYLVMSIIIYIAARFAPADWENPHPCDKSSKDLENIWNIKNCLWLTLGSLMSQGCDILPKGISTRMITGMWWFFSLIMCSSYTANLAAFLTMERMGPTIENAEDLSQQTKIKYGCVTGGATGSFFRDSNFSTYHRMWSQMLSTEPSVFEKSNKGVKRVKTSKRLYAFLMESSSIEYEKEKDCELMQVGGWLDTKGYGIAMPVNSPYRTAISGAVLKMQEDGKLHKLKEKWWKKMHGSGKCSEMRNNIDPSEAELGIRNVGGVFVVLLAGIIFSLLVAIFEFIWNVRTTAIENHLPFREVFDKEWKFIRNFNDRKKASTSTTLPSSDNKRSTESPSIESSIAKP